MNLEKLIKQLRRDIAANPKKAAALGLMVVVALYFWGPLAWKFVSTGGGKRANKLNASALILTDDPAESGQQSKGRSGGGKFRWEKVRQLIRQDPRMQSATFDIAWIDPFGKSKGVAISEPVTEAPAEDPAAVAAAQAAANVIDPKDLGVTLGGVMVGPKSRLATINGETCREGDLISLGGKQDKTLTHEYRVLKIGRQVVQLERSGRIFSLELTQPKLAQGDDIERRTPKESN